MSFYGKSKAVTFSYDDGVIQDRRLVALLNKYNLKCTFNLNSGVMTQDSRWSCNDKPTCRINKADFGGLYDGHEVAMHFLHHPYPTKLNDAELEKEISEDIANLEQLFGCKVNGGAYPYGEFDERIASALKKHGMKFMRTVIETKSFDLQDDLIYFNPTCHHSAPDLMELAEEFVAAKAEKPMLFYVWGHSYEFDGFDYWDKFEEFCKFIANRDDIFYGTNSQVFGIN